MDQDWTEAQELARSGLPLPPQMLADMRNVAEGAVPDSPIGRALADQLAKNPIKFAERLQALEAEWLRAVSKEPAETGPADKGTARALKAAERFLEEHGC